MTRTTVPVRDGTRLAVQRAGTAGGLPVVFLHAAVTGARSRLDAAEHAGLAHLLSLEDPALIAGLVHETAGSAGPR